MLMGVHILQEDLGFLSSQAEEQQQEVGGADAQHEFVSRKKLGSCSESHIGIFLTLTELFCSSKKQRMMVIPLEEKIFSRHFVSF